MATVYRMLSLIEMLIPPEICRRNFQRQTFLHLNANHNKSCIIPCLPKENPCRTKQSSFCC
jgi:hypothetical protein